MTDITRDFETDLESPQEEGEVQLFVASQWQLIWWKFRKHKMAMAGTAITLFMYLIAIFVEFLAPYTPEMFWPDYTFAPPQTLYLFDHDENGGMVFRPFVYGYYVDVDEVALRRVYSTNYEEKIPVGFFVQGAPYKFWGLFESRLHLISPIDHKQPVFCGALTASGAT